MNERILERTLDFAAAAANAPDYFDFLCECGHIDCTEHVQLSLTEYQEVRSEPTHFALLPGHLLAEVETVAWQTDRFVVVEKQIDEDLLERTDPRS